MTTTTFRLLQRPSNGCLHFFIMAVSMFVPFFGLGSLLLSIQANGIVTIIVLFVAVHYSMHLARRWTLAQTAVTVTETDISFQVERAGLKVPMGKKTYPLSQLKDFLLLKLKGGHMFTINFKDQTSQIFTGGQTYELRDCLTERFPEKRIRTWDENLAQRVKDSLIKKDPGKP